MKFVVCCVRDVKAATYGSPFFLTSVGQAERQFGDEINRAAEDNVLYKHPEDFELFWLGDFDASSCEFKLFERPQSIAHGSSLVQRPRGDVRGPLTAYEGGKAS